ncbi:hypothetical protein CZ794_10435 [Psychrobacter sp. JB385]|nr:hypothetical protein CZ794_10435 [Psychrobacter sp. JB385]
MSLAILSIATLYIPIYNMPSLFIHSFMFSYNKPKVRFGMMVIL